MAGLSAGIGEALQTKVGLVGAQLALPAEIINLIIDELGHDTNQPASTNALRSCALVSRVLCMRAYHYLFSEIKLSIFPHSGISSVPERLRDMLVTSLKFPGLGMVYHIRCASLEVVELESSSLLWHGKISDNTALPEILDALHGPNHGISSFGLEIRLKGRIMGPEWSSNGRNFNAAFQRLCRSRNLKSLQLTSFNWVPKTLLHGTNIECLNLDNVYLGCRYEEVPFPGPGSVIQPRSIAIQTDHYLLEVEDLLDLLHGNVERTLDHDSRSQLAFTHLTDFTICAKAHIADLRQMHRLRSLCFVQPFKYAITPRGVIGPINEFFSFPENTIPPSLAHLTIEIKAHHEVFTSKEGRRYMQDTNQPWKSFDSRLAGSQFQNVQDIRLVIHFGSYSAGDSPPSDEATFIADNKEIVLRNLPLLMAVRPTTFFFDIVVDKLKSSDDVRKPEVMFKGPHLGWW